MKEIVPVFKRAGSRFMPEVKLRATFSRLITKFKQFTSRLGKFKKTETPFDFRQMPSVLKAIGKWHF